MLDGEAVPPVPWAQGGAVAAAAAVLAMLFVPAATTASDEPANVEATAGSADFVAVKNTDSNVPSVSLSAAPNPVREGSEVTVTVALSEALENDLVVPLTLTAGTAEAGDYTSSIPPSGITIAAGSTSNAGTVDTAVDADDDDETFTVAFGSLPSSVTASGETSATVTIADPRSLSLAADPNPVNEGSSITVTAGLSKALAFDVTVPIVVTTQWNDTAESGDYTSLIPKSGITIAAGTTSNTGTVETAVDADNDDEFFSIGVGHGPTTWLDTYPALRAEITDPPLVNLSAAPNPVNKGSPVTIQATLSKHLRNDVTIPITLTPGTASADDYGSLSGISISAGKTAASGAIATAYDEDTGDETFAVALGDLPSSVAAGSTRSVTVTIDPDPSTVLLSAAPNPVDEGSAVTVTVTLSRALRGDVTIPIGLTAGTAEPGDYGSLSGITIAAGAAANTGTITTTVDADNDDETLTVALGNLPPSVTAGSTTSVLATIHDPPFVTLSAAPNPVDEGSPVTLTATLSKPYSGGWTVHYYLLRPPGQPHALVNSHLTVAAGARSGTWSVATAKDPDFHDYEFGVRLADAHGSAGTVKIGTPSELTVTVADADEEDGGGDGGDDDDNGGGDGGGGGGGGAPPPGNGDQAGDGDQDGGNGGGGNGGGPPRAAISANAECADGLCRALTGVPVRFRDGSSGAVRSRRWEFGDGSTSASATPSHSWSSPGFYSVTLTASDGETESTARRIFLVEAAEPAGSCEPSDATRCLQDSRFAVELERRTAEGETAAGHVVREGTNDSALFHLFEPDNWEVLVKVLDGCAANGSVWVYGASATTTGYTIRVTDTVTGRAREYRNEPGERARSIADAGAFPGICETGLASRGRP